jgi:hypothetical protein
MKIFLFGLFVYFLVLFLLCSYWAKEWHPEIKFKIGFLASTFHIFMFLVAGFFSFVLAKFILKIFVFLSPFFGNLLKL